MGRSLFSTKYIAAPAVHTEPEHIPQCEKWSIDNKFDPDSDEFFANAVDEAFIDLATVRQQQATEIAAEVRRATVDDASPDTSDLSDGADSDPGSPMDEAVVFLTHDGDAIWQDFASLRRVVPGAQNVDNTANRPDLDHIIAATRPNRYSRVRRPVLPEGMITARPSLPTLVAADVPSDVAPVLPQTPVVATAPVIPQARARSPSPTPAALPSTPARNATADGEDFELSPPGTVTPARLYTWTDIEVPSWTATGPPASPTRLRGSRSGPLTNHRARVSYARLAPAAPAVVQDVN